MTNVVLGRPTTPAPQDPERKTPPRVPPVESVGGLLAEAPALARADWLPEGSLPELDELRAEHQRIHALAAEVGAEVAGVRRRHEEEDARHAEAVKAQALGHGVEVPKVTPPEARAAELAALEAKAKATREALEEFLGGAVAMIAERHDEWASVLDERDAEGERRVEEARQALAEAEAALGSTGRLRRWLMRTAGRDRRFGNLTGRHIAYPDLPAPPVNSAN